MLTTTQTSLFKESKYINKHLFRVSLSVHGRWFRKWVSDRDGVASDRCFPFLFSLTDSSNHYQYDSKAFLFSLVNRPGWAPVKLPQTGRYSSYRAHSVLFGSSYGPTFGGGHDIQIFNSGQSSGNLHSNLGCTYSAPSGHSYGSTFAQTFLAGTYTFTPDEVETFYESN